MNMKYSLVQLMDLPNEILMMIFKKLTNEEVLYSIMGINIRLNRIISDPSFTNQISLIKYHSSCDFTSALPNVMLDRFYFQILLKFIIKSNGFILKRYLWNVFFLLLIILTYVNLIYSL
jgi:hypothetical protein